MNRVVLLTIAILMSGCGATDTSDKKEDGQNNSHAYRFLWCKGKLYAGSEPSNGQDHSLSLYVKTPYPNKDGPHSIGLYSTVSKGLTKMDWEIYDVLYIGPTLIEFGQSPEGAASNGAGTAAKKREVFGRLVKGSGLLEISWDDLDGEASQVEWRGRCTEIANPVLTDIDGILDPTKG